MKKCIDSGLTGGFEALRFAIRVLDDNAPNYSFDLGLVAATDEKKLNMNPLRSLIKAKICFTFGNMGPCDNAP